MNNVGATDNKKASDRCILVRSHLMHKIECRVCCAHDYLKVAGAGGQVATLALKKRLRSRLHIMKVKNAVLPLDILSLSVNA